MQGVPRTDESVCRASRFVRTVSLRTSNDGVYATVAQCAAICAYASPRSSNG